MGNILLLFLRELMFAVTVEGVRKLYRNGLERKALRKEKEAIKYVG